ncbi:MAG TPA: hypothetical protein VK695_16305 [Steroidobacteraceae bacterium]|nr:hypothetical protein [Steroidobacteraceae bacterium]
MDGMKIGDAVEFQRLLYSLVRELVDANIVFKLHSDLERSVDKFENAMNESRTFWLLTLQSTLDAAAYRLCKIYDQRTDGANLRSLLQTLQSQPELFLPEEYAKRVPAQLAEDPPALDAAQLARDVEFATAGSNPLVKKLLILRHNFYAPLGASHSKADSQPADKYPISRDEIESLLRAGMAIANRYSIAFRSHSHLMKMVGQDDFVQVLEAVHERITNLARRRDEQLRRLGVDPNLLA